MEGQEGVHRGHEGHLQRPQREGRQGRPGGLCPKMGGQVLLCHKELEGQLGRTYRVLRVPLGNKEDSIYHQPYREPQRQDQEVNKKQTIVPNGRCGNEIRIFGGKGGHQEMVDAHQELGHHPEPVPYDL